MSEFLRGVFITGALGVYPIYYEAHYDERVISATIGSLGYGLTYLISKDLILSEQDHCIKRNVNFIVNDQFPSSCFIKCNFVAEMQRSLLS